jgi:carboxylate-amine ligase
MSALPHWAEWHTPPRPWTVGLEEEVMLLEPTSGRPAGRSLDVLAALPPELAGHAFPETHACALELTTRPHGTVAGAAAELDALRRSLHSRLSRLGLRAGVAGTHPLAVWSEIDVTAVARYQEIHASMRELARREPTFALHVHVAVPEAEAAARALAGLREDLPLLLALSANSPYWQARDTGLASARIPLMSMFPRAGIPPPAAGYAEYVAAVDLLTASGAVRDPSFLWWDARLRPRLGTLEVRIMDAQTYVRETAALAALVQCLVRRRAEVAAAPALTAEALAENRFLAARDGIAARLIRGSPARLQPAANRLARVLWDCVPIARELGCERELEDVATLVRRPGHARQRAIATRGGPAAVVARLADDLAPARARITAGHRHASLSGHSTALTIG